MKKNHNRIFLYVVAVKWNSAKLPLVIEASRWRLKELPEINFRKSSLFKTSQLVEGRNRSTNVSPAIW